MSNPIPTRRRMRFLGFTMTLGMTIFSSGCSVLLPKETTPPLIYVLDGARVARLSTLPVAASATSPALVINPTRAAPGFDSQHIVYVRVAHQLERYARSDWVDTPARMLMPLIVSAVETPGGFRAVGIATSGIAGDLRLDTEVLRLQQEFGEAQSRVRFTLRAILSNNTTRQVISWQEFDETILSESADTYGGVIAANRAVQIVLQQLGDYCTLASEHWRMSRRIEQNDTGSKLRP